MRLSTSSSDAGRGVPPGRVARMLARWVWAPAVVCACILAAGQAWSRLAPGPLATNDIESIIVSEQLGRARSLEPCDVLVLGDSSGLMDVDASALDAGLGTCRVQSLASIGYAGPAAYGALLETADRARDNRFSAVVLFIHAASLGIEEKAFDKYPFERWILSGENPDQARPLARARDILYSRGVARAMQTPLPGSYGRAYGFPRDLRRFMATHHGSLIDPNPTPEWQPCRGRACFAFRVSPAVDTRLRAFSASLDKARPQQFFLGVTPMPEPLFDARTRRSRDRAISRIRGILGADRTAILPLPQTMPADDFAEFTHLNARGRAAYTAEVRKALAQRLPCAAR